jgi:hypothetical protein
MTTLRSPVIQNVYSSIRCSCNHGSNERSARDWHSEKQDAHKTVTDAGRVISVNVVLETALCSIRCNVERYSNASEVCICSPTHDKLNNTSANDGIHKQIADGAIIEITSQTSIILPITTSRQLKLFKEPRLLWNNSDV